MPPVLDNLWDRRHWRVGPKTLVIKGLFMQAVLVRSARTCFVPNENTPLTAQDHERLDARGLVRSCAMCAEFAECTLIFEKVVAFPDLDALRS